MAVGCVFPVILQHCIHLSLVFYFDCVSYVFSKCESTFSVHFGTICPAGHVKVSHAECLLAALVSQD